jgi:BASS family bile acid:Na+ symporter
MDPSLLIKWAMTVSLLLIVFGLGLRATFADTAFLFRELFRTPHRLLRAIVAMFLVVPAVAVAIAMLFDLPQPVKMALLAMAVSPMPPILPGKQMKFGGQARFVYGLLVAVSLAAIVVVPIAVEVLSWLFQRDVHVSVRAIATAIAVTILAPLAAGLIVRHVAEHAAERLAPWVARFGTVLLIVSGVFILINAYPAVALLVGSGAIVAFVALAVLGIAVGHSLGGPNPRERTVLAIAAPMRHPGVAITIAHATFPNDPISPAAILLMLLVGVVVTTVYGHFRSRSNTDERKPA